MAAFQTAGLTAALQALDVDPQVIDQVVSTLNKTSAELSGGDFATQAEVPVAHWGARASAQAFGGHYQKAHDVMQATIDGMATDLLDFASNAKTAIAYVSEADGSSAVDLNQAQQAIENLNEINNNSQADANYNDSRNNPGGS